MNLQAEHPPTKDMIAMTTDSLLELPLFPSLTVSLPELNAMLKKGYKVQSVEAGKNGEVVFYLILSEKVNHE